MQLSLPLTDEQGAHTLFTSQRDRERERKIEREKHRERKREGDKGERLRKRGEKENLF